MPEGTMTASAKPLSKRERILHAAEREFALSGYHGATMREIATQADVGLPLIVYHFESKEKLYAAVFENRASVSAARLTALEGIGDIAGPEDLEQIVDAYVDPMLDLHESEDGTHYAWIVLREVSDPASYDRPQIKEMFAPVARSFTDAMRRALPDKPAGFHEWAYVFTVGAVLMSALGGHVGEASADPTLKRAFLKQYICAALRNG